MAAQDTVQSTHRATHNRLPSPRHPCQAVANKDTHNTTLARPSLRSINWTTATLPHTWPNAALSGCCAVRSLMLALVEGVARICAITRAAVHVLGRVSVAEALAHHCMEQQRRTAHVPHEVLAERLSQRLHRVMRAMHMCEAPSAHVAMRAWS